MLETSASTYTILFKCSYIRVYSHTNVCMHTTAIYVRMYAHTYVHSIDTQQSKVATSIAFQDLYTLNSNICDWTYKNQPCEHKEITNFFVFALS